VFDGFDDDDDDGDDGDDDLDPEQKEAQDREVEEFARRLNSVFGGGPAEDWAKKSPAATTGAFPYNP